MQSGVKLSDSYYLFGVRTVIFGTFFIALYLNLDKILIGALLIGEFLFFMIIVQFTSVIYYDDYLIVYRNFKKDKIDINDIDSVEIGGWPVYLVRMHFKKETKVGQEIAFYAKPALFFGIMEHVDDILKKIQIRIQSNKRPASLYKSASIPEPEKDEKAGSDIPLDLKSAAMMLAQTTLQEKDDDSGVNSIPIATILIGAFLLLILYAIYSMIKG